ncbi:MAG TPA: DEAD/DEAH box helicase family protein [Candidatus Omnitrophota bacterium]|nr:DEAD/DEAH box helicase family protein [Candidatus Omnitrophota bacterium]
MSQKGIDQLIICSPYEEPKEHWHYIRETQSFERHAGRRESGYWRATVRTARNFDDPGEFQEIELVNKIRPRVKAWKENGYPNVTGVTRKLLQFWTDNSQRESKLFWCQLEAVETAIWLTEASPAEKQGIEIPADGSGWERQCLKLATGTGKTVVMAMLISWQALNKIANSKDPRFSKNILVVAPGITVRDRLQVLKPENAENFYQQFNLVDSSMWQELLQAKIIVTNWHSLAPINENYGPKVVKKGPESNEAFFRRILPDFGNASNVLVINDEAHHCHRPSGDEEDKEEEEKATIWISGIDRIHNGRGVLKTYDLTATPFKPTGKNIQGEQLFPWIVSDFGLNDAIESGLVKTPKVAVRDDSNMGADLKTKLFHIYPEVREDLNRRAEPNEGLPDLVRNAMTILGGDWLKEKELWEKQSPPRETPPVMIMICNRIETAARVEYSLLNGFISVEELGDRQRLIRIDQDALDKIEAEEEEKLDRSKKDLVLDQREKFNTVGKKGKAGELVQCVIGVNMMSEGWDARTVTHILGLRAFTSQLLCEQVIGRGLRRISYDVNEETGLYEPEYVTVFGVPFTFLPAEQKEGKPKEEKPKTKIAPIQERGALEIDWPHVLRVDYKLNYFLDLDWNSMEKLTLSPEDAPTVVEVAPTIDNKPRYDMISEIDLAKLAEEHRLQGIKLQAAVRLHEQFGKNWEGDPGSHISQLMQIFDEFLASPKLDIKIPLYMGAEKLRNIVIAINAQKIINHIGNFIRSSSKEAPTLILDPVRPKRSTATAMTWYTSKPTQPVKKSQLSHIVIDSGWEKVGLEFERNRIPGLVSWVKNDHLGFEIFYLWQGQTHTYYPDYIIRFESNRHLILEVKGQTTEQDKAKWQATKEWINAVNVDGRFGTWEFKVLDDPKNLFDVVR